MNSHFASRFIDPDGNFKFVPSKGYVPNAGELRFDMFDGEFTHQGDKCTFEVLHDRYLRHDAALRAIAEVVHDIDYKDEKFGRPETPGVATVIRGIAFAHSDDASRITAAEPLFEGLYAFFQRATS